MGNPLKNPIRLLKQTLGQIATKLADSINSNQLHNGRTASEPAAQECSVASSIRWLEHNRLERMDATVEIFNPLRREFHLDRYRFAAERVNGKNVLDCACGTGYGVRLLKEAGGAAKVVGVDVDDQAVAYARRRHQVDLTAFICASGDSLPMPAGSLDIVTSFETVEHVPDDASLIKEFHRVLRPQGVLIISTPNQWPLKETPFHVREYNRKTFVDLLEAYFGCVEFYNQNSGSSTPYNHDQARGIVVTTAENEHLAECYLAVCQRRS